MKPTIENGSPICSRHICEHYIGPPAVACKKQLFVYDRYCWPYIKLMTKQNTALVELCREMARRIDVNTAAQMDLSRRPGCSYLERLKQIIGEE